MRILNYIMDMNLQDIAIFIVRESVEIPLGQDRHEINKEHTQEVLVKMIK